MLRDEFYRTLRPYGVDVDENIDWVPLPGEQVCDVNDRKNTHGIIISVQKMSCLVLWTVFQEVPTHKAIVAAMSKQICEYEDNEIMKILMRDDE